MPYLNETGLSYYNGLLQPWIAAQGVKDAPSELFNFQQTAKVGAVTLWPVGGTPFAPVVDYIFTETPPANGQPKAPDNPSTITGVSSATVTRCGKNIIPYPYWETASTEDGITWSDNGDGTITASGIAESIVIFWLTQNGIRIPPRCRFSLSGCPSGGSYSKFGLLYSQVSGSISDGSSDYGSGGFIETGDSPCVVNPYLRIASGTVISTPITFKPLIELGTTTTAFEPYDGTDYTIPLGNTYYGGSIDLATGTMTVTYFFISFTGDEDFSTSDKGDGWRMFFYKPSGIIPLDGSLGSDKTCTHFPFVYSSSQKSTHWYVQNGGNICMFSNQFADAAAFKTWLATQNANETPVQVTYQMSTPYTVQLSPVQISALLQQDKYTPRLNTVYSDQSAVQVGYVKSPIRNEFELQQAVTALGGNV